MFYVSHQTKTLVQTQKTEDYLRWNLVLLAYGAYLVPMLCLKWFFHEPICFLTFLFLLIQTHTHTGLEQENELEFKPELCFNSSPNKLSLWIWITPRPPLFTRCNIFCLNNKQKVLEVNETPDDMKGRAQQFNMLGETSMNSSLLRDILQLHDFSSGPAANSRPDPCCEAFLH